jgi:hypothetical protein
MLYKDTEKEVNIFKIIDYAHIPEVRDFLSAQLNRQRQKSLKKRVDAYNQEVSDYFQRLFLSKQDSPGLYWFELTQYKPFDWRITHMAPHNEPQRQPHEILPRDAIGYLGENMVIDPKKVVHFKKYYSVAMQKRVDIQAVRYSANFILGTVKDHVPPESDEIPLKRLVMDHELAFRTFYRYMKDDPKSAKLVAASFVYDHFSRISKEKTPDPVQAFKAFYKHCAWIKFFDAKKTNDQVTTEISESTGE